VADENAADPVEGAIEPLRSEDIADAVLTS
jgi:hypothetical protein